jgi:peptidoglycan hydrolase-like protein with peptidoglycan-binding domain
VKGLIVTVAVAVFSASSVLPAAAQQPRGRALLDLDVNATPNLDRDSVRRVQRALRDKVQDVGPLDGVIGPRTREAVRAFQDRYGIKATGIVNNQTLLALGVADAAIQARP